MKKVILSLFAALLCFAAIAASNPCAAKNTAEEAGAAALSFAKELTLKNITVLKEDTGNYSVGKTYPCYASDGGLIELPPYSEVCSNPQSYLVVIQDNNQNAAVLTVTFSNNSWSLSSAGGMTPADILKRIEQASALSDEPFIYINGLTQYYLYGKIDGKEYVTPVPPARFEDADKEEYSRYLDEKSGLLLIPAEDFRETLSYEKMLYEQNKHGLGGTSVNYIDRALAAKQSRITTTVVVCSISAVVLLCGGIVCAVLLRKRKAKKALAEASQNDTSTLDASQSD